MTFDKTKAMRNAEKFLSQGKISSAIGEFRQVVTHDPRDFSTMNMLGDLYAKNAETRPAADCYKVVAEHYAKQGFAQKAIAIYNKISRLQPNTLEITERLAELYKEKGSLSDARVQYEQLADIYKRSGRKIEALETWKKIAELDPNKPEVFMSVAQGYEGENCVEEAAEAYAEAGRGFSKLSDFDSSFRAFERSLNLVNGVAINLEGYVAAAFESGKGAESVVRVEKCHQEQPFDREIFSLLVDCYVRSGELDKAEKSLIKLIEQDPASYPKLLELSRMYMATDDETSAARVLSMSSEHMLMDGKAEELSTLVTAVLDKDPEQLAALRMKVRCMSWLKDETRFRESLNSMVKAARNRDSVDDERFALSQIVMIAPHESEYADRLKEINELHGFEQEAASDSLFDKRFVERSPVRSNGNGSAVLNDSSESAVDAFFAAEAVPAFEASNGFAIASPVEVERAGVSEVVAELKYQEAAVDGVTETVRKEIDSIRFYIESGYTEIAEKAIGELRLEHGEMPAIKELLDLIKGGAPIPATAIPSTTMPVTVTATNGNGHVNGNGTKGDVGMTSGTFDLSDLTSELGFDDSDADGDYETHYSTAVAYQEMYLLEEAIKEYQQAVSLVEPNDGTRRFFQCANLLGHCFMQHGKPNLAVRWFLRTLETVDILDEEKLGLWYELANAYEADGDYENAARYYDLVYTENINFRDVSERVNSLTVTG